MTIEEMAHAIACEKGTEARYALALRCLIEVRHRTEEALRREAIERIDKLAKTSPMVRQAPRPLYDEPNQQEMVFCPDCRQRFPMSEHPAHRCLTLQQALTPTERDIQEIESRMQKAFLEMRKVLDGGDPDGLPVPRTEEAFRKPFETSNLTIEDWRHAVRSVTINTDPDGLPVPLPQKPQPEEKPYIPQKFGEHD